MSYREHIRLRAIKCTSKILNLQCLSLRVCEFNRRLLCACGKFAFALGEGKYPVLCIESYARNGDNRTMR